MLNINYFIRNYRRFHMAFGRVIFETKSRMGAPLRGGDGFVANPAVFARTSDADLVLTVDQVAGGLIHQAGTLTAERDFTIPIGTDFDTFFPTMDVGDAFCFLIVNANAGNFAVTIVVNTGVSIVGETNVIRHTSRMFTLIKTGTATYNLF